MPKRNDLKSILIIGAGPIVIGQACEFDYSGAQACKALRAARNCALDLAREGVLEKFGVEMIGASREAIDKAEDREKFKHAMRRIGLACPRSALAHSMEEALQVQAGVGFPAVIRPSFTLGGSGGGIAY